jgi:bacillithiol system protein YtxJ
MKWNALVLENEFEKLIQQSYDRPQVIFKHSYRCGTSGMAKNRLEKAVAPAQVDFYLLDVIGSRPLSLQVAENLGVWHESPQAIVVKNGKAIYDESHIAIRMDDILENAASN